MENNDFPQGLIVKSANVDFVKARLSFKVEDFINYLKEKGQDGWVNIDILESKTGNLYSKLNDWKKAKTFEITDDNNEDLPF